MMISPPEFFSEPLFINRQTRTSQIVSTNRDNNNNAPTCFLVRSDCLHLQIKYSQGHAKGRLDLGCVCVRMCDEIVKVMHKVCQNSKNDDDGRSDYNSFFQPCCSGLIPKFQPYTIIHPNPMKYRKSETKGKRQIRNREILEVAFMRREEEG